MTDRKDNRKVDAFAGEGSFAGKLKEQRRKFESGEYADPDSGIDASNPVIMGSENESSYTRKNGEADD